MLLVEVRVYPKCNSHSRLLTSLILHRARRPALSDDLPHGRLIDHAHPRKLHDRYNVHDEFRRILYHHHKSIASTRQQQASWKYDARIIRHQLQPCQPFAAAESIAEGVDFVFVSPAYRNNTTNLENDHIYYICPVKSNGSTGLHVYAHRLVKLWEHTTGQVELSTHISTKKNLDAINLKVSGV